MHCSFQMHRVCMKVNLSILKILQTWKGVLLVFKLKRNVYEKRISFKENVSVFTCRNAPSVQEEENPTSVGDLD